MNVHDLPAVNATLNGLSALLLGTGFVFIKRKNVPAHRACMIAAFSTSVLFLICYLTYHALGGFTKFQNPAWFRPWYLVLLATHTIQENRPLDLAFVDVRLRHRRGCLSHPLPNLPPNCDHAVGRWALA
jgi:uncharacterized membrane protein YozB (DUF420 family)